MKQSDGFYKKLTEHLEKNKDTFSLEERVIAFNNHMIEELKGRTCAYCDNQIIGKGHVIHDSFGVVDYHTCNRDCADKFIEKLFVR